MQEDKFSILNILGYVVVIGAVTFGIIYTLKNFNTPIAESPEIVENNNMQNELKIEDVVVGTGTEAIAGKSVTVHYTGTLIDGTKFDSSKDHGEPFTFNLGAGEVIRGWDQGVVGMKIGGKRILTIPSELGYGVQGAGNLIPPNAVLVFEVELLGVN